MQFTILQQQQSANPPTDWLELGAGNIRRIGWPQHATINAIRRIIIFIKMNCSVCSLLCLFLVHFVVLEQENRIAARLSRSGWRLFLVCAFRHRAYFAASCPTLLLLLRFPAGQWNHFYAVATTVIAAYFIFLNDDLALISTTAAAAKPRSRSLGQCRMDFSGFLSSPCLGAYQ